MNEIIRRLNKQHAEILLSIENDTLYEYIAQNYYTMSRETLKDIILELVWAIGDNGPSFIMNGAKLELFDRWDEGD